METGYTDRLREDQVQTQSTEIAADSSNEFRNRNYAAISKDAHHENHEISSSAIPVTSHGLSNDISIMSTTPEHYSLGNLIKLQWHDGKEHLASNIKFKCANGLEMTYGRINSLAGDFYGTYKAISDATNDTEQRERFMNAFNLLDKNKRTPDEVVAINIIDEEYEIEPLKKASPQEPLSKIYSEMYEKTMTKHWYDATSSRSGDDYPEGPYPSYLGLSLLNFDHFGQDARATYTVGHKWAIEIAATKKDPAHLEHAYRINAFADHFLEDAFSAGHLRTPRRELHSTTWNIPITGPISYPDKDMCSKFMHDEDSALGLKVVNAKGDSWTCYGDSYLFDSDKSENKNRCVSAVEASAAEIYKAWDKQDAEVVNSANYAALELVPTIESANGPQDVAPLFRVKDGILQRRGKYLTGITQRTDWSSWANTTDWTFSYTATVAAVQWSGRWNYPLTK